jgi:pimeloyl-ACP methyl ester carboxylesterase
MDLSEYTEHRRSVKTEFGEFAYLDIGEGPVAVFVHGLFVSGYLWRNIIEQLQGERRCIAYNLPGHGYSRVSSDADLSLQGHAAMLEAFCDELGFDTIDLVANDTGGAIAQVFAVRNRQRVRSLTLTNCEARDVLPSSADFAQLIKSFAEQGQLAPAAIEQLKDYSVARSELGLGGAFEDPEHLSDGDIHGYLEHHYSSLEDAREIERIFLALHVDQLTAIEPQLRELETPTLVVWGTADPIFETELAYWLRDTIPGCQEVVEVAGGQLFWPGERPGELVEPLRRHWSTVDDSQAAAQT